MAKSVLCLRPEADFTRVGVSPPVSVAITYASPADAGLAGLVAGADALVIPAVGPKLSTTLFEGGRAKFVQVTGAGVDRLDVGTLKSLGVSVANIPGGSNSALAEYVVAAAATLQRRMPVLSGAIKAGNYAACRGAVIAENVAGLDGLTAGIIGLGVIGMAVAERLASAGCRIVFYDPSPRDPGQARSAGWASVTLDELLATADIVTIHVPLLPQTTGLIARPQLRAMKAGSILINAARGGIVDEAALAGAIEEGHLGGAAVDVYSTEPPTPDNPLLNIKGPTADRLLLTPHIAGITRQAWATLFKEAWANVERVLVEGRAPLYTQG